MNLTNYKSALVSRASLVIMISMMLSGIYTISFSQVIEPEKSKPVYTYYTGDEVFSRPDKNWGFNLNLAGYIDLTKIEPATERVAYAVREDSIGLSFAGIFIYDFPLDAEDSSSASLIDVTVQKLNTDSSVIPITITRDSIGIFQTALYDKIEIWPQPDPKRPGQTFDSTFTRRHFRAATVINDHPVHLHFSKTEYRVTDSLMFRELLSTFKLNEDIGIKSDGPSKAATKKK